MWDVIVVGAGPAGLNAALVLGRSRRTVLVIDNARPRNAASQALHGFLTRDGVSPSDLRRCGRQQIAGYPSVRFHEASVIDAARSNTSFSVQTDRGEVFLARKLLLAAGVVDELPEIPGFKELYGTAVFHCPYCDGWEVRDQPLAIYGKGDDKGAGLALELLPWSRDVVLCTDGPSELTASYRERLWRYGISVQEAPICRFEREGDASPLFNIVFDSGPALRRRALFFNTGRRQSTNLAERLGCGTYGEAGCTVDNKSQATTVAGLYVAGDASRDVLQAIVAAAEGAQAAIAISTELLKEDFP